MKRKYPPLLRALLVICYLPFLYFFIKVKDGSNSQLSPYFYGLGAIIIAMWAFAMY